jgi:hypothetical protein
LRDRWSVCIDVDRDIECGRTTAVAANDREQGHACGDLPAELL